MSLRPYYDAAGVTLYHGDCREVLASIDPAECVLVTDPPYGMAYQSGWRESSRVANDDTTDVREAALQHFAGRPAIVFGRWSVPRPDGVRIVLYWDKGDWPGMGDLALPWGPSTEEIYIIGGGFVGKRAGQIVRDPRRPNANSPHPTEKPLGLMCRLVGACPPGVIVDPFAGSGSTLVAAKQLGRRAIGIELEERYCEVIAKRLAQDVLPFGSAA